MRIALCLTVVCCFLVTGCDKKTGTVSKAGDTKKTTASSDSKPDDKQPQTNTTGPLLTDANIDTTADSKPAPIDSGVVKLSPANAKIEFVGKHVDASKPDRIGGFERFSGEAAVDADKQTLRAVELNIETGSLWTQFPGLTSHLNSPDFFDTREHPTAQFKSKRIESDAATGEQKITGEFTLMGNAKEITIPAKVRFDKNGLALTSDFTIDRTEFGMDKLQDDVKKEVTLKVVIGEKTEPQKVADVPGPGAGGGSNK